MIGWGILTGAGRNSMCARNTNPPLSRLVLLMLYFGRETFPARTCVPTAELLA